jgi:hypothetical protein
LNGIKKQVFNNPQSKHLAMNFDDKKSGCCFTNFKTQFHLTFWFRNKKCALHDETVLEHHPILTAAYQTYQGFRPQSIFPVIIPSNRVFGWRVVGGIIA